MNAAEKLQKLIEIAWSHGWKGGYFQGSEHEKGKANIHDWEDNPKPYLMSKHGAYEPCDVISLEEVIFDHDFIKALCRKKYDHGGVATCALCGEPVSVGARSHFHKDWEDRKYQDDRNGIRMNDDWCESCDSEGVLMVFYWQYIIQQLAISTDRIGFLYGYFCEQQSIHPFPTLYSIGVGRFLSKYNCQVDANQRFIVDILRKRGFQVVPMHTAGKGFPDLIVAKAGQCWLVEVKDGAKRLTDAQTIFHSKWVGPSIQILRSEDDALRFPL